MQMGKGEKMRLIDGDALYESTAEWEASAFAKIEELNRTPLEEMDDAEKALWRKWTAILNERTAFKQDVFDAPTIESCKYWDSESSFCALSKPSAEPDGMWEIIHPGETGYSAGDFRCSVCGQPNICYHLTKYCCNCGARMVNRGKVKKRRRDEQGTNDES